MVERDHILAAVAQLPQARINVLPLQVALINSVLSLLDASAHYFFASLKSYLEHDAGSRHAILSGHDLARWVLKTAKAAAVSWNLARGGQRLSGAFSRDEAILDMLDDPRHWPEGAGLYSCDGT